MFLKVSLFFISLFSILQVLYKSTLPSMLAKPIARAADYQAFLDESKNLVLWLGLILALSCFLLAKKDEKPSAPSNGYWMGSFLALLVICAAVILIVNPEGRFPWNERDAYVSIAPRPIKPNLYAKLKNTPDVLIFGSSISFTTPAHYFAEKWGLNAFNMSLSGGTSIDFVNTLNQMIFESPDKKTPSTLIIEILSPSLKVNAVTEAPVKLIRYMPPDQGFLVWGVTADHLLRASFAFDSIFTLLFVDTHRWEIWIDFKADGTGERIKDVMPTKQYENAVRTDVALIKNYLTCDHQQLNQAGKEYLEKLIGLSHDHQFSIVFYRPPINNDFYTFSKTEPALYAKCRDVFNRYMATLTKQNPNVFYKDLSNDTEISLLAQQIYTDTHHLNERGNLLVMKTLNNEIEAALQWAKTNHK